MATKRRVRKKNIKEDQLVTVALRASRYAQEHFSQVILGVAVLVAVIAIVVFTANSRQSAAKQGQRQLSTAMTLFQQGDYQTAAGSFEQVYTRYGGQNGLIARFFKAESELNMGNYTDALADYEAYLKDADKYPAFRASAVYGKALCEAGLQNYSLAATTMESLKKMLDPEDPRYYDSTFQAGEFFAKAGEMERAAECFRAVAENGSGRLKDEATAAAALLEQ